MSTQPKGSPGTPAVSSKEERRVAPRRNVVDSNLISVDLAFQSPGLLLDVSETGIGVQALASAPTGATTPLHFELPDHGGSVEGFGTIAWTDSSGRLGIEFDEIPDASRQHLAGWLSREKGNGAAGARVVRPPQPGGVRDEISVLRRELETQDLKGEAALGFIVERVRSVLRATGAAIALDESGVVICRASSGSAPEMGTVLDPNSGLSGECVRTGEIVRCEDTETDPRVDRLVCRKLELRSAAIVPIRYQLSPIGLIEAFSSRARAFESNDVLLLRRAAELVSALVMKQEPHAPVRPAVAPMSVSQAMLAATLLEPFTSEMSPPAQVAADLPPVFSSEEVEAMVDGVRPAAPAAPVVGMAPAASPRPPVIDKAPVVTPVAIPTPAPVSVRAAAPAVAASAAVKPEAAPAKAEPAVVAAVAKLEIVAPPAPPVKIERTPVAPASEAPKKPEEKTTREFTAPLVPPIAIKSPSAAMVSAAAPAIAPVETPVLRPIARSSGAEDAIAARKLALPMSAGFLARLDQRTVAIVAGVVVAAALGVGGWRVWRTATRATAQAAGPAAEATARTSPAPASNPQPVTTSEVRLQTPAVSTRPATSAKPSNSAASTPAAAKPSASKDAVDVLAEKAREQQNPAPITIVASQSEPKEIAEAAPPPAMGIGSHSDAGLGGVLAAPVAKPSLVAPAPAVSHVSGGKLISRVNPVYPQIAGGLGGDVTLTATVGRDGKVKNVKVVKGSAILAQAAVRAVQQWRYEPYMLNGVPTELEANIVIHFKEQGR
ncbi:MAG: TonB family protein [Terriglobales bacterium]